MSAIHHRLDAEMPLGVARKHHRKRLRLHWRSRLLGLARCNLSRCLSYIWRYAQALLRFRQWRRAGKEAEGHHESAPAQAPRLHEVLQLPFECSSTVHFTEEIGDSLGSNRVEHSTIGALLSRLAREKAASHSTGGK